MCQFGHQRRAAMAKRRALASFRWEVRRSCAGSWSANANLTGITRSQVYASALCEFAGTKIILFGETAWICSRCERGIVDEEKRPYTIRRWRPLGMLRGRLRQLAFGLNSIPLQGLGVGRHRVPCLGVRYGYLQTIHSSSPLH